MKKLFLFAFLFMVPVVHAGVARHVVKPLAQKSAHVVKHVAKTSAHVAKVIVW